MGRGPKAGDFAWLGRVDNGVLILDDKAMRVRIERDDTDPLSDEEPGAFSDHHGYPFTCFTEDGEVYSQIGEGELAPLNRSEDGGWSNVWDDDLFNHLLDQMGLSAEDETKVRRISANLVTLGSLVYIRGDSLHGQPLGRWYIVTSIEQNGTVGLNHAYRFKRTALEVWALATMPAELIPERIARPCFNPALLPEQRMVYRDIRVVPPATPIERARDRFRAPRKDR